MAHLIIYAHPNKQSFNHAILQRTVKASNKLGVETVVRDLYNLNFNPVLSWEEVKAAGQGIIPSEIQFEQQLITQAKLITLIYPLWWMGFPAILKGYLDRVLTHGFAYKTDETGTVGLIHNKRMQQFITIGNNEREYQKLGFDKSLNDCLINGLFNYCGIIDVRHQFFGDIHLIDEQARLAILKRVEQITEQNLVDNE
jgi:hypothetical protein